MGLLISPHDSPLFHLDGIAVVSDDQGLLSPSSGSLSPDSASSDPVSPSDAFSPTLTPIEMSVDSFEMLQLIGRGSFGKVVLVRLKSDPAKIYAMKVMKKKMILERNSESLMMTEKVLMAAASHPFIVRLHFAFQDPERLYLVMDFVNGGDLYSYLRDVGAFPEERARLYICEIFLAVSYLHEAPRRILHRDLKPENIIVGSDGHLRLTDFGLATVLKRKKRDPNSSHLVGTIDYVAPEVIVSQKKPLSMTKAVVGVALDYWSIGCLLYDMLFGKSPFHSRTPKETIRNILRSDVRFPNQPGVSAEAIDLVQQLLTKSPANRLTSPRAFQAHPFFAGVDFEKVLRKEVVPSYVPDVESALDTKYIDAEYLQESVLSPPTAGGTEEEGEEPEALKRRMESAFEGYEFRRDGQRRPRRWISFVSRSSGVSLASDLSQLAEQLEEEISD